MQSWACRFFKKIENKIAGLVPTSFTDTALLAAPEDTCTGSGVKVLVQKQLNCFCSFTLSKLVVQCIQVVCLHSVCVDVKVGAGKADVLAPLPQYACLQPFPSGRIGRALRRCKQVGTAL